MNHIYRKAPEIMQYFIATMLFTLTLCINMRAMDIDQQILTIQNKGNGITQKYHAKIAHQLSHGNIPNPYISNLWIYNRIITR
jgi:hypothetical protein